MRAVRLINTTPRMVVLNLPHDLVPEHATMAVVGTLAAEFKGTREDGAKAGPRQVIARRKPISGSLTLLAKGGDGSTAEGLPVSVLEAPDVKKARNAKPPQIKVELYDVPPDEASGDADPEPVVEVKAADIDLVTAAEPVAEKPRKRGPRE